ncbi:MAG: flagellar hook-length control protein FliK [Rhodobacteraceae bacterium]|nr:flagellar hook-length control protein FliK [Paracoccaceae bacterium]
MPLPLPARSDGSAGLPAPAVPSAHTLPPTPVPDLVARQILPNLGTTGAVTVTISPVELGTLVFEVSPRADGLHLHLTVEMPATLDLLRRQGDQILAELRQAGFANASLSFAGQDGQPGTDPQQRQAGNDRTSDAAPEPSPQPPGPLPPRSLTATPGTLDLRL